MRFLPVTISTLLIILLVSKSLTGILLAQESDSQDSVARTKSNSSPNPKYGDDTPESTIRSFYTALAMADRETVDFLLVTPKELREWVDAQLKITYAFQRFSVAAKSQFGDDGKSLFLPSPGLIALNQLKEVKPQEEGDKAQWATNPRLPTKLIRIDGHWKMDLLRSFEKPEHIQLLNREFARTAAYIDAIAQEMESGRYKSLEEVRAEMKRRKESGSSNKN